MTLKTILFLSLFFKCLTSFGQFKQPELKIIKPEIILPEDQIKDYAKSYNKKLKKTIIDKATTEYDKNGNITKEITVFGPETNIKLYTYKNNVLVEKIDSTVTDSREVKRLNDNNIREAESSNEVSYAVALFEEHPTSWIYKAVLDKKNRVISYTSEQKKIGAYKSENWVHQTNIVYDKDKILDVITNNVKEHYTYNGNLLVKSEKTFISGKINELEATDYSYDNNKNLIRIKYLRKKSYDGKVHENTSYTKDSAVYNTKNKLIWQGDKKRFMTYKYDSNNNITERCQYTDGKERSKDEYFYENKLLTKVIQTHNNSNKEVFVITTNYNYKDGKLIGHQKGNEEYSYEYDDAGHLKKITKTNKYINKKTGEVAHQDTTITNLIYNKNILTIQSKYDNNIYEFYE